MTQCPKCGRYALGYDNHFHCYFCLKAGCNFMSEIRHESPNRTEPDSLACNAEAWLLRQGLPIPDERRHPHLFQGMIDDYLEAKHES